MRQALLLLIFVGLIGCGKKDPIGGSTSETVKPSPAHSGGPPEDQLYEELRSGAFQLSAASSSIEEAVEIVRKSKVQYSGDKELVAAIGDIEEAVNSAGASLSDFTEAPAPEDVKSNFQSYDDMRIKAIEGANDALRDIEDAIAIVTSLTEDTKHKSNENLKFLEGVLDVASKDIHGAVEALGGKVEEAEEAG